MDMLESVQGDEGSPVLLHIAIRPADCTLADEIAHNVHPDGGGPGGEGAQNAAVLPAQLIHMEGGVLVEGLANHVVAHKAGEPGLVLRGEEGVGSAPEGRGEGL